MDTASTTSRVLTYLLNLRYDQLYQLSQIDPHDIHPHARIALQTGEDAQCDKLAVDRRKYCQQQSLVYHTVYHVYHLFLEMPEFPPGCTTRRRKPTCQKQLHPFSRFDRTATCDRQTGRQTDRLQPYTSRE